MNKNALYIIEKLNKAGYIAYYAGGSVRDMIMGLDPKDIDIATDAKPEAILKLFKTTIPVGIQFGVVIVMLGGKQYEVATFRADSEYIDGRHPEKVIFTNEKEDALRRDFTINGMFFDPINKKIIDYIDGQKDIKNKIIKAINEPCERFDEDKLRILRAIRFSARFNFEIEKKTKDAIKKYADKINLVSSERIRDELIKMMVHPSRSKALDLLHELGLLKQILPEVEDMVGMQQPPQFHPEGDVFKHTKLALDYIGENPSPVLAMATLLHDVGKPPTYTVTDRIRFHGHCFVGSKIADKILKRLKFSNEDRKNITLYVKEHMRFTHVKEMRIGKLKKMLQRESILEEIKLHEADCLACHGIVENRDFCLAKLKEFSQEELKPKPLITGNDLIKLGFKPSSLFKKILDDIENQQLEDGIKTKKQAKEYIKAKYIL